MADLNFLQYYKPIDYLTPMSVAQEMVERNRNSKTQRMFAENQAKRQSAQDLREQQEFEQKQADEKRKEDIEQAHALQTIGMLHPTNPGAAEALANAYGIHLNPLTAATPVAQAPSFDDQLNHELAGAGPDAGVPSSGAGPAGYPKPPDPVFEGPQESPDLEERMQQAKPDAKLEALMSSASAAPKFEAASYEAPKPSNPLFEAVIGNHHYQLPSTVPGTGLGKKYDDAFSALVQSGMDPAKAREHVFSMYSDDNKATNIASRTAEEIKQREQEKENYGNKFALTAEQRQGNTETAEQGRNRRNAENNKTRLEAAALMGGPRQEQADTGKRTQYMGVVNHFQSTAGTNADLKALKNLTKIKGELSPDSSATSQQAAADTLAQIAQGGKAGVVVMRAFNNHSLGPLEMAKDKAYQATHNGRHSQAWIDSLNSTVRELRESQQEIGKGQFEAFEDAAGSRSAYAQDPEVAPHVEEQRRAFAKELGIPLPNNGPSDSEKLAKIMEGLGIK
jgi:hypothetical protein